MIDHALAEVQKLLLSFWLVDELTSRKVYETRSL
jgi:hypothetical protein